MIDKKNKKFIRAIINFALICLIFIESSSVAFGQLLSPYYHGSVTGTVYYSDEITPLPLNDKKNGSCIELWNTTSNSITTYITTDDSGKYKSPQVRVGSYYLSAKIDNNYVGTSKAFNIKRSLSLPVDLTTSRMSTS